MTRQPDANSAQAICDELPELFDPGPQCVRTDKFAIGQLQGPQLAEAVQEFVNTRLVHHAAAQIESLHVCSAVEELLATRRVLYYNCLWP